MTATADPGFIGDLPPRRRSAQPAPLDIWLRSLLIALMIGTAVGVWFVCGRTPLPAKLDVAVYSKQLGDLDRQVRSDQQTGGQPITLLFLGTSRMRNVAFDPAAIAQAAREAGVKRPVASVVLGINWGGFERFQPLLPMIEQRRPNVIVVMPELLTQDFSTDMRLQLGLAWMQSHLWDSEFRPFPADESVAKVCNGFADSAAARDARDRSFVASSNNGPGPREAREFLRRMARQGTLVLIADVPVSKELAAIRPMLPGNWPSPEMLGLAGSGIQGVSFKIPIDRSAYCDYAHINPARSAVWRQPFFQQIAAKLNALPGKQGAVAAN